jgi:hypothetical protein
LESHFHDIISGIVLSKITAAAGCWPGTILILGVGISSSLAAGETTEGLVREAFGRKIFLTINCKDEVLVAIDAV